MPRKRRFKTGLHSSPKCPNQFKYRSGWELIAATIFDNDPNVLSYEYESLEIPYISNQKTKKIRRYYPDFLVTYVDKHKAIIEVKRDDKIGSPKTVKKAEACKTWAEKQKMSYQIWGWKKLVEEHLRVLGPMVKEKKKPKKKTTPKKPKRKRRSPLAKKVK